MPEIRKKIRNLLAEIDVVMESESRKSRVLKQSLKLDALSSLVDDVKLL